MKNNLVVKNTLLLTLVQVANQLLPLVTIPYLTRVMGVEVYGVYAYAMAVVAFGCMVTDFGFNLAMTPLITKNRNNRQEINKIIGEIIGAKIILYALISIFIVIYIHINDGYENYTNTLLWLLFPLFGLTFQPIWYFNGMERMAGIATFVLVSRLIFMALIFLFVRGPSDLLWLIMSNGLSQVVSMAFSFLLIKRDGYWPKNPEFSECIEIIKMAVPFFWGRAAESTYSVGGALFLGTFSNPRQVAIYAAAEQMYKGLQSLLMPISQVMYPYMVRTKNFVLLIRMAVTVCILALIIFFIGILFGDDIINLLFGDRFKDSSQILKIFFAALVFSGPSMLMGYPMFGAVGELGYAIKSVFLAGVVQILILTGMYFFDKVDAGYAAFAVVLVELIVLVTRCIWGYSRASAYLINQKNQKTNSEDI